MIYSSSNTEIENFKDHPLFESLLEEDIQTFKISVEKVRNTSLAHSIIIPHQNGRNKFLKVEFYPEFGSMGEVTNVVAEYTPTNSKTYKAYLFNQQIISSNSENSHFSAYANFDQQLKLRDYFTESDLDFKDVFAHKRGIEILKKWVNGIFNEKTNSGISISEKDSGSMNLNLISMGLNKKSDLICIKIESIDKDSLFNSLNHISELGKNILDTIPADIAMWDLNHRYIFLNKTACKDDRTRNWFRGKDDFEYCNYRNKPIHIAINRRITFNKMLLSGKQTSVEERFETSEGPKFHLRIFKPVLDPNGLVKWALGYGLDITSVKNMEADLGKMSIAVKDAMDGIGLLDKNGKYIYVNEAHIKMFGYQDEKDFLGNSWEMLYEDTEIERLKNKIFPQIMANGRWAGETRGKLITGESIFQEITLTSLADNGLICICRDKTEERNQKLRLERAAVVTDNTSSVVIITDSQIRIQWVNKAFTNVTGYTLNDAIGKDPSFLHGPETDTKELKKIFKRLMNKKGFSAEVLNYSKTGRKYWMQINTTPIFNEEGELVNFISVENDITQLKQVEEDIKNNLQKEKELNELKSQFVSIASHEIRTPLAGIQTSAELIKLFLNNGQVPKEKIEKHVGKIEDQISRLSTIISNLLTVGSINLGKFDLHKKETDIEVFIKNIISEYFSNTPYNRSIIFTVSGNKRKSKIDKLLMSQVLINLFSNAIKYSIDKSEPEVKLQYEKNYFTIQVKDYGIGIPKDQQKNIFNSFFRANNVENIQGTGLGLVIVKKFVEVHKGKISFTSDLDKGSIFKIKFPYQ
jgi:PAS domain S-box-containing protein